MALPKKTFNVTSDAALFSSPTILDAKGDGSVDDGARINGFLNHPSLPRGATIYIPAGRYRLDQPLRITSRCLQVTGDTVGGNTSTGTWLLRAGNHPALEIVGTAERGFGNSLRNVAIGNYPSTETMTFYRAAAIRVVHQAWMRFDNVSIYKSRGNGIYLEDVWDSLFHQVFLRYCGHHPERLGITGTMSTGSGQAASVTLSATHPSIAPGVFITVANQNVEAVRHAQVLTVSGTTVTLDQSTTTAVSGATIYASSGPAAVFLRGPGAEATNNCRFVSCHFEHNTNGQMFVVQGRQAWVTDPKTTNTLYFTDCKFEPSGRIPDDGSPFELKDVSNSTFTGCLFSQYYRGTGTSYMMSMTRCLRIAIDGVCYNDFNPTGFALLTDCVAIETKLRGYECGDVIHAGKSRNIETNIWDQDTPMLSPGRFLLDYPPFATIDLQRIATSGHKIEPDTNAPRGRALSATSNGTNQQVLSMRVGGAGLTGITVFALVRSASGTARYSFDVSVNNGTPVTVRAFSATNTYSVVQFPLTRAQVPAAGSRIIIRNVGTPPALYIAELGWLPNNSARTNFLTLLKIALLVAVFGWLLFALFRALGWI